MSKNLEIESKTLLDKDTYEKMRDAFTAKSDFIQKTTTLIHLILT
ncbi:hypothetical protein HMPREF9209_0447 [Lactobacillus gasseri 224-1]|uniref:Uncharacterized protein n=1 Tax=Lactobacillus gasseri 224-1 TaxID=679196 RepID=D1YH90_LACGS|nr:hypothetical protein HMPREF9209_0447 [Lactobacillus gasseri 224-1]